MGWKNCKLAHSYSLSLQWLHTNYWLDYDVQIFQILKKVSSYRAGITCHLIESKDGAQSGNTIILSLISQQRGFLGNFLELLSEIRTFNPVFEKSHN